ncbi:MAG TPA: phosphoribosylanthranilate isomerase [Terriglobia bacterium]|nr:phosphoribosylanthranilate isomerase [Terriglobia bacterium]
MMTRVKICGITRDKDACLAIELGASALGFNFYSRSPRYLSPETASAIASHLPPFVSAVGVFADEVDGERVAAIARRARMTAIQLHGPRFPKQGRSLDGFPLIRAVSVMPGFTPNTLKTVDAAAILLDAFDAERIGGSGKVTDWQLARQAALAGKPIILAGGLTPENVAEAVEIVKPYAVDVATGVESSPGIKDAAKLQAFFAAVNHANGQ